VTPAVVSARPAAAPSATRLPQAPAAPPAPAGIAAESLARRIDQFLASRGYAAPAEPIPAATAAPASTPGAASPAATRSAAPPAPVEKPADFVCEDDVRQAVRTGRKIKVGERTIVTPAARDLAEQHKVFVQAEWPRA
jgi:hypothetical protein